MVASSERDQSAPATSAFTFRGCEPLIMLASMPMPARSTIDSWMSGFDREISASAWAACACTSVSFDSSSMTSGFTPPILAIASWLSLLWCASCASAPIACDCAASAPRPVAWVNARSGPIPPAFAIAACVLILSRANSHSAAAAWTCPSVLPLLSSARRGEMPPASLISV